MKRFFTLATILASLTFGVAITSPSPANAASMPPSPLTQFAACDPGVFFGFPTWYACLPKDADGHPKLTQLSDVWLIAFPLLESAIKLAAYVAVGFILWGGIRFIKSQGNPGEITSARDTIRDAIIGLAICLSSVAIVQFLASRL
jgi:hypothetical protein